MIDSHCHLTDKQFADDLSDVFLRAEEHGVHGMICIADSLQESKKCLELAENNDQIFCTIGCHPHNASSFDCAQDDRLLQGLIQSSGKAKAVGEIGLDYFYDNSPREKQKQVFRVQLQIAKELHMPVVIHNRESWEDLWGIVQEVEPPQAVLHCCTEPWERVQEWVAKGYWVSFTGIVTYPKSEEIRECIRQCPLDQLMIETDAPYLAPVPHRGKRNEPAYVVEVAKLVAELKGISLQEVDQKTTENTLNFFDLTS